MKTINNKECGSSTGRIALIIKSLWANYYKSTLWAWSWIIFAFTIFPRLGYILSFNVDYLLVSEMSGTDFFVRAFWVSLVFAFLLPQLFNKFVRNSKPTTFASIPANLKEKVIGMLTYFVFIMIGAFGVTYLTVVIDYLLAPYVTTLGMSEDTKDIYSQIFSNAGHIRQFIIAILLVMSGMLTLIYTSVRFKKFIAGLGVGVALWLAVLFLVVSFTLNETGLNDFILSLNENTLALLIGSILAITDIVLFVLIAKKLKRIEN